MRHFDLPLQVLLGTELHWWLARADTESTFTAELRPVGFSEAWNGECEEK
jgi:hypothetical protein